MYLISSIMNFLVETLAQTESEILKLRMIAERSEEAYLDKQLSSSSSSQSK